MQPGHGSFTSVAPQDAAARSGSLAPPLRILAAPRQRMMRLDQPLQPLGEDVRIYLRSGDIGVPQQQLQTAEVGAACQQM